MNRSEAIAVILGEKRHAYKTPAALREALLAQATRIEESPWPYSRPSVLAAGLVLGMKRSSEGAWMVKTTSYWTAHTRARPAPEWQEVETPAVEVSGENVELRTEGEFVYVTFHAEKRGRFRIRLHWRLSCGGLVLEREIERTGGSS